MNEMIPQLPQELQDAMTGYYASQVPSLQFAARLEAQLRQKMNSIPRRQAIHERWSFLKLIQAQPLTAILIALIILLVLSGVAYALGRILGYIPGIGLVDQTVPLRVLVEPVSVTREGITLTIEQVVLSTDRTVLVYKVEGIPEDAYARGQGFSVSSSVNPEGTPEVTHEFVENTGSCIANDYLLLPDGTRVVVDGGSTSGSASWFERRLDYGVVPAGIYETKIIIPCIDGTILGRLPEDWELPLRFMVAPPQMTVLPVIESAPSTAVGQHSTISVEQVIEKDDSIILIGTFRLVDYPSNVAPRSYQLNWVRFTDVRGQVIEAFPAPDIQFEHEINGGFKWAFELKGREHAWPLTITFDAVPAFVMDESAEFTFDTGENPQVGQTWTIDPDVQLAGHDIQTVLIKRTVHGYEFHFKVERDLQFFGMEIKDFPTSRGGGSNDGYGRGEIYHHLEYNGKIPSGKLVIKLSNAHTVIHGPWHTQWSPEAATSLYGISLHLDQFIPLEDGYYLIGHTEWGEDRIASVDPGAWVLRAYDVTGREVPIEPAVFEDDVLSRGLQPDQWAYRLYGKNFTGPLTLRASQMDVEFKQPVRFTLDLSSQGFDFSDQKLGTSWELEPVALDVPGMDAHVSSAAYIQQGDLRGFEFIIQADRSLRSLGFTLESGLMTDGMDAVAGSGGSIRDERDVLTSIVLTNAPMQFPLVLSANNATLSGSWETIWTPPVDTSAAAPVFMEHVCLDLPRWRQIAAIEPLPVPADLKNMSVAAGAYLPEGTSIPSPDRQWIAFVDKVKGRMGPGVYVARADGSGRRLIAQLDHWLVLNDLSWSHDSYWVGFSIVNTDLAVPDKNPYVAIDINSCNLFILANK